MIDTIGKIISKPRIKMILSNMVDQGELEVEKVTGKKGKRGIVGFPMGVVDVDIKPPYRTGKEDIVYIRRKEPAKGKGSMQKGLKTRKGEPPGKIVLSQGLNTITIKNGRSMQFGMKRSRKNTGPGIMMPSGRVKRQRRRSYVDWVIPGEW